MDGFVCFMFPVNRWKIKKQIRTCIANIVPALSSLCLSYHTCLRSSSLQFNNVTINYFVYFVVWTDLFRFRNSYIDFSAITLNHSEFRIRFDERIFPLFHTNVPIDETVRNSFRCFIGIFSVYIVNSFSV